MREITADFVAESAALDAMLATLSEEQWLTATPALGWDVRDSVTHLAIANELAEETARTGRGKSLADALASGSLEDVGRAHLERGRALSPADVLTWWRDSVRTLADALGDVGDGQRLPWGPNTMSVTSFTTARLMETWAHGLDCFDAVAREPIDTARLHHVAHLGLRALPYAFAVRGLPAPGPVRLQLTAPDGSSWRLGDDEAPTMVAASAGDWCRVAVHRDRRGERSRLQGSGPDAEAVIANVQAYLSAPR